jgi:cell division protein FtsB
MRIELNIKKITNISVLSLMLLYLAFHALHGDQGLIGGAVERYRQARLAEEIAVVRAERLRLQQHISMMSGTRIDADLLDELARKELSLKAQNQIIIVR